MSRPPSRPPPINGPCRRPGITSIAVDAIARFVECEEVNSFAHARSEAAFLVLPLVRAVTDRACPESSATAGDHEYVSGIRLTVDEQNDLAAIRVLLPGQSDSDPGIFVLFPEHVTAREHGRVDSQQLYLFRPGRQSSRPAWRRSGHALEYQAEFPPGVRMVARATLEEDGVRYRYEFLNRSKIDYDMIQAVTDPRMVSPYFHDVRLERT